MGRAYTDEEKEEIKKRLWEEGLKFFHDGSEDKLNIRKLTSDVGISLGSFYSFYPDKEKLVEDICVYRANQKLDEIRSTFEKAKEDPREFIYNIIYFHFFDMAKKVSTKKIYADAFSGIKSTNTRMGEIYAKEIMNFFEDLDSYLNQKGVTAQIDAEGLWNMIIGLIGLYLIKEKLDEKYAGEIYEIYLRETIKQYVTF